jgi:PadR family transcriptional regulator PadR
MRRRTRALEQVAIAIMDSPNDRQWGYDLWKKSGVRSGVLYPMLTRMLNDGWLTDGWEDPSQIRERRPPRRYYELTELGRRELGAVKAGAMAEAPHASPSKWGLANG